MQYVYIEEKKVSMSSIDHTQPLPDQNDKIFLKDGTEVVVLPESDFFSESSDDLYITESKKGGHVFKSIVQAFQGLGKEEHLGRAIGKGLALTTGSLVFGLSCIVSVGLPVAGAVVGAIFGAGVGGVVGVLVGSAAGIVSGLVLGAVSAGLFKLGGVEEEFGNIFKKTAAPASVAAVPIALGAIGVGAGLAAVVAVVAVVPVSILRLVRGVSG